VATASIRNAAGGRLAEITRRAAAWGPQGRVARSWCAPWHMASHSVNRP